MKKTLGEILFENKGKEYKILQNCTDPFEVSFKYREKEIFKENEFSAPKEHHASVVHSVFGIYKHASWRRYVNRNITLYIIEEWLE